jgi:hypothetical protein
MASTRAVHVDGLRELDRAFKLYGRGLEKGLTEVLTTAAEPVRTDAQVLAVSSIPRIGVPWSRVRIGVTRHTAYIAPVQRGSNFRSRRTRPNLKSLLLDRAYEPALDRNITNVERELGDAINDLGRAWSRL